MSHHLIQLLKDNGFSIIENQLPAGGMEISVKKKLSNGSWFGDSQEIGPNDNRDELIEQLYNRIIVLEKHLLSRQ